MAAVLQLQSQKKNNHIVNKFFVTHDQTVYLLGFGLCPEGIYS